MLATPLAGENVCNEGICLEKLACPNRWDAAAVGGTMQTRPRRPLRKFPLQNWSQAPVHSALYVQYSYKCTLVKFKKYIFLQIIPCLQNYLEPCRTYFTMMVKCVRNYSKKIGNFSKIFAEKKRKPGFKCLKQLHTQAYYIQKYRNIYIYIYMWCIGMCVVYQERGL